MKNITLSTMDMTMIMVNRTRKKMTSWLIDVYCGILDVYKLGNLLLMSGFFNTIVNFLNKIMQ